MTEPKLNERDGRMWCWAPNPEASGIMGDVCDGCSDNEECMVGVLRERVADLKEKLEKAESLPYKWIKERAQYEHQVASAMKGCADELMVVLRSE